MLLKIKIAVLWIFLAVAMSASMILWFMAPGAIDEIMYVRNGEGDANYYRIIIIFLTLLVCMEVAQTESMSH